MGILLNLCKRLSKNRKNNYEKYCMWGNVKIEKDDDLYNYSISLETYEMFNSKEELYAYYETLYDSFNQHFEETTTIELLNEVAKHSRSKEDIRVEQKIHITKKYSYYGVEGSLYFTGTMLECKYWFEDVLLKLQKACFKNN